MVLFGFVVLGWKQKEIIEGRFGAALPKKTVLLPTGG
jgi:hypothetical protein